MSEKICPDGGYCHHSCGEMLDGPSSPQGYVVEHRKVGHWKAGFPDDDES